jgi:hypothetical protein
MSPANAAEATIVQGGPFTSRSTQVQVFSQAFNVLPDQTNGKLTMTFNNGIGTRKFAWLRVFITPGNVQGPNSLAGRKVINEYSFRTTSSVAIDLTGLLRAGTNTVGIQGAGVPGAYCNFNINCTKAESSPSGGTSAAPAALRLSGVDPSEVVPGGELTIRGSGFSDTASKNIVTIYNRPCTVSKASQTELVVKAPAGLAPHSYTVDVTVNGVKSNSLKFDVTGTPELQSCSLSGIVPGSTVELNGNNFSKVASQNVVTLSAEGVRKVCNVSSASKQSLTISVPEIPELAERINGGGQVPATISLTVNGMQAGSLSIMITVRPMVQ